MSNCLRLHGLYSPWNSPGWNTAVGSLSLLQGIFPTQELNQSLLLCRQILYQLSYQGSPHNVFLIHKRYILLFTSLGKRKHTIYQRRFPKHLKTKLRNRDIHVMELEHIIKIFEQNEGL